MHRDWILIQFFLIPISFQPASIHSSIVYLCAIFEYPAPCRKPCSRMSFWFTRFWESWRSSSSFAHSLALRPYYRFSVLNMACANIGACCTLLYCISLSTVERFLALFWYFGSMVILDCAYRLASRDVPGSPPLASPYSSRGFAARLELFLLPCILAEIA